MSILELYNIFLKYFFEQVRDKVYKELICAPNLMTKDQEGPVYIHKYLSFPEVKIILKIGSIFRHC